MQGQIGLQLTSLLLPHPAASSLLTLLHFGLLGESSLGSVAELSYILVVFDKSKVDYKGTCGNVDGILTMKQVFDRVSFLCSPSDP